MMAAVAAYYNYVFHELADQRTRGWLIQEPCMVVTVLVLYLSLIYYWLPKYMERRKRYKLKTVMQLYNVFQIFACGFQIYGATTLDTNQYWYGCYPTDYSNSPMALRTLNFSWSTLLFRYIDLIETTFFVLRKKYQQVSVLHVYHHVTTLIIVWIATKYVGGGVAILPGLLNASVHIVMYLYYFLAATGPKMQDKLARVKPILTILQIIQLCFIIAVGMVALRPDCDVSIVVAWLYIPNIIVFLFLFVNFYAKTYTNKLKKKQ